MAQGQISRALESVGIANATINFDRVATILPAGCSALDTYRSIRNPEGGRLTPAQNEFKRVIQTDNAFGYEGQLAAKVIMDIDIGSEGDFSLLGVEPTGAVVQMTADRSDFLTKAADQKQVENAADRVINQLGPTRYRLTIGSDNANGWTGFLMISGKKPFPPEVTAPPMGSRGPDWREKFVKMASDRGWAAEMVWVKLT
jgi:serine/threonine-protein kinase